MTNNQLLAKDYDTLFVDDFVSNGKIAQRLNALGAAHKTVCPECGVDDFTHVEGCSKLTLIEHI